MSLTKRRWIELDWTITSDVLRAQDIPYNGPVASSQDIKTIVDDLSARNWFWDTGLNNIYRPAGNVRVGNGNLTLTQGDLNLDDGNATLTQGNLTLNLGYLRLYNGYIYLDLGDITLHDGDLILDAGDIDVDGGGINVEQDLVSELGDLRVLNGNADVNGSITLEIGTNVNNIFDSGSLTNDAESHNAVVTEYGIYTFVKAEIAPLLGGMKYQGTWDVPTDPAGPGSIPYEKGDYWVVNVAGTASPPLTGESDTDFQIGDWAVVDVVNGVGQVVKWSKIDSSDNWITDTNGIKNKSGNVGIGGNSSASYVLYVYGNTKIGGSITLNSGTDVNNIVTTLGNPGSDNNLVTEAAIRTAISGLGSAGAVNYIQTSDGAGGFKDSKSYLDGGQFELNLGNSGDRLSYVDFHSDDTHSDYSARIIRNAGANAGLQILNNGASSITLEASGHTNFTCHSNGHISFEFGTTVSTINTTVGDPGSDDVLVTEQGIREALDAVSGASASVGIVDTIQTSNGAGGFKDSKTTLTNTGVFEINVGGSGDRTAIIDFHSNDTDTDFAARIERASGVNTNMNFANKGSGSIVLEASGHTNFTCLSNGHIQFEFGTSVSTINTTVGNPGSDDILVTEQGIREAITAAGGAPPAGSANTIQTTDGAGNFRDSASFLSNGTLSLYQNGGSVTTIADFYTSGSVLGTRLLRYGNTGANHPFRIEQYGTDVLQIVLDAGAASKTTTFYADGTVAFPGGVVLWTAGDVYMNTMGHKFYNTGATHLSGSIQLEIGTSVNEIKTTVGDPGTDDIICTEQGIREAINASSAGYGINRDTYVLARIHDVGGGSVEWDISSTYGTVGGTGNRTLTLKDAAWGVHIHVYVTNTPAGDHEIIFPDVNNGVGRGIALTFDGWADYKGAGDQFNLEGFGSQKWSSNVNTYFALGSAVYDAALQCEIWACTGGSTELLQLVGTFDKDGNNEAWRES